MDDLFALFEDWIPIDWLLGLFDGGGPRGDPFQPGPSPAQLLRAIERERRRRNVAGLVRLETERRRGELALAEFSRRYARIAGREPSEDPAAAGPLGPHGAAIERHLARLGAAGWDSISEHLVNLEANPVVRTRLLPRHAGALDAAIGAARLSAAEAVAGAVRARLPEERQAAWALTLAWLTLVLVTDPRAAESAPDSTLAGG